MRKLLVVLAIAALVAPAMAADVIFGVTADGSMDAYRSGTGEGYSNGGGSGSARLQKANQNYGWLSFYGAVADGSGQSLAAYLAANPGKTANLYMKMASSGNDALPAGTSGSYMISIRSGNTGPMVEDGGGSSGFSTTNVAPGYAGASELQAFAGCPTYPAANFPNFGDGIYYDEDPANADGTPWITPSGRVANTGSTPYKIGANTVVQYDKGLVTTGTANGKFIGYFNDTYTGGGRSFYAFEDVLGLFTNKATGVVANIQAAGQIMNGGFATPTLVNASLVQTAVADPRNASVGDWVVVPIDAAFLADMAFNAENKGLMFTNHFTGLLDSFANPSIYTKEQSGGASGNLGAYLLITPEPCTMILLALGGVALLRRRPV